MRKILPLLLFSASSIAGLSQSAAVNIDGTTSHPGAMKDIKSTRKPDTSSYSHFIDTTDWQSRVIRTNNGNVEDLTQSGGIISSGMMRD